MEWSGVDWDWNGIEVGFTTTTLWERVNTNLGLRLDNGKEGSCFFCCRDGWMEEGRKEGKEGRKEGGRERTSTNWEENKQTGKEGRTHTSPSPPPCP